MKMKATYTAYVASDLYQAGYSCDGHPYIAENFYVVVENNAGRRFAHNAVFNGTVPFVCEESGDTVFPDMRAEASGKADRLAVRVNAVLVDQGFDGLVLAHWEEIDPAYGSDEYLNQGTEYKRFLADQDAV